MLFTKPDKYSRFLLLNKKRQTIFIRATNNFFVVFLNKKCSVLPFNNKKAQSMCQEPQKVFKSLLMKKNKEKSFIIFLFMERF